MLLGTLSGLQPLASNWHNFIYVSIFCLLHILYSLSTFFLFCPFCMYSWKYSPVCLPHSPFNVQQQQMCFFLPHQCGVQFWHWIFVSLNLSLCLFGSLILLPFPLNLFSHKYVSISWSLSSCTPRSFLKISLDCVEHHFQRDAPPLDLGGAVPALYFAGF